MTSLLIAFLIFILGVVLWMFKCRYCAKVVDLINASLFYLGVPITIFDSIYKDKDLQQLLSIITICLLHMTILFILSYLVSYLIGLNRLNRALAVTISVAMPNTGYVAIPLAVTIFGNPKVVTPYTIAFNVLLPIVIMVLGFLSKANINKVNTFTNSIYSSAPFLTAFALALIVNFIGAEIPWLDVLFNFMRFYILSSFVVVGYEFAKTMNEVKRKSPIRELSVIMFMRYVMSPLLILLMISLINVEHYGQGLLLQSIMPPAVTNIVLAKEFKLDLDIVLLSIVVLTPISILLAILLNFINLI